MLVPYLPASAFLIPAFLTPEASVGGQLNYSSLQPKLIRQDTPTQPPQPLHLKYLPPGRQCPYLAGPTRVAATN